MTNSSSWWTREIPGSVGYRRCLIFRLGAEPLGAKYQYLQVTYVSATPSQYPSGKLNKGEFGAAAIRRELLQQNTSDVSSAQLSVYA